MYGCTDEDALNYNPDATDDDGSCVGTLECGSDEVTVLLTLQTEMWGGK